ncbi:MAG TPA: ABC transporter substrate-binding protein [Chloroflexota bacterium]|nr:ABC transporter substrate-binding protein [Chloroflexota bacterium]
MYAVIRGVVASVALAGLALGACSSPTSSPQARSSATAAPAGASATQRQLVIGFSTEPAQFDRAFGGGSGARRSAYAFDRQAIVDGLYAGKSEPLYFWLPLEDQAWAAVDRAVTKYAYDPARSEALLRDAGWTNSADGLVHNGAGHDLHLQILNESQDIETVFTSSIPTARRSSPRCCPSLDPSRS